MMAYPVLEEMALKNLVLAALVMSAIALTACGGYGDGTPEDDGSSAPATTLEYCAQVINNYRSDHGRPALAISEDIETCATEGAQSDALSGTGHGHFIATQGCSGTAMAENEIPGWPLAQYGTIEAIIDGGTAMMMDEGPGGGHYENILGPYTQVGCGIYVTDSDEVWVVQEFR